jgi:nicotinate phosphoribosyltransferase
LDMAKLYDGVRHDSGDPFIFGDRIIAKYESYNIDPKTKSIVFSDALDFDRALAIQKYFEKRIKVSFGIGTNLTNDVENAYPLNIVMKLKSFQVNSRQPVYRCVKLSDVSGKELGEPDEISSYKIILGL